MIPFVKGKIWYIIVGVEKEKGKKKKKKMILLILTSAWLLIGGCLHHLDLYFLVHFYSFGCTLSSFLVKEKERLFWG